MRIETETTETLACDGCERAFAEQVDASYFDTGGAADPAFHFCPECTKIMLLALEGRRTAAPTAAAA